MKSCYARLFIRKIDYMKSCYGFFGTTKNIMLCEIMLGEVQLGIIEMDSFWFEHSTLLTTYF